MVILYVINTLKTLSKGFKPSKFLTLSTLKLDAVNPFANVILVSEFIAFKTKC